MLRGNSAIFGVIRGRERTGGSPTRLGPCPDGFYGINRLSESLLQITNGGLDFNKNKIVYACAVFAPYSRNATEALE